MDVLARPHRAVCRRDDPHASFHAWAISSGRWRVSMPGWCCSMSAQNVPTRTPARVDQGVVVQRGAAFIEVADENVADRAAADVVVVDQFRGRSLAAPQRGAEGELGWGHPDHAQEIPGHVQSRDLFASGVGVNAPREHLQDVVGGQRVDVLTGMQHDLADQAQRVATVTATEPAFDRGLLEAGEHLRPHDLAHPIEQAIRPVGGQEVITGQDDPAHQQARQPARCALAAW